MIETIVFVVFAAAAVGLSEWLDGRPRRDARKRNQAHRVR